MKRAIYLTILGVIEIVCIIVGIVINVGGIGSFFNIKTSYISKSEEISVNDTIDAFEALDVDLSAAELIVQTGDGYGIHYEGSDVLKPTCSVKGGTLKVESPYVKRSWRNHVKCSLTITVPEHTKLTGAVFDIDAGNVECTGISAENLSIDVNAGNVEVYNAVYGAADVDVDAGNVTFADCTISSVAADSNMGNVEFGNCTFDRMDATTDMGNVTVQSSRDLSDYSIDMSADLGNISINGQDMTGRYKVDGDEGHFVNIDVSMGNAELFY